MHKKIIVVNGPAGTGKDSFIKEFSKTYKTVNFSSVDKVKEIARMIGWDGGKTEKDRKFLSDLKALTTEYNDMAYKDTCQAIDEFNKSDNEYMFIHIRESKEIERIVKDFGAHTLLVKRDGVDAILSNDSDALVFNYKYDYELKIDKEENLGEKVIEFMNMIQK